MPCGSETAFGISSRFQLLSQSPGQVSHVFLTRSPLDLPVQAPWIPFDLHVLSTPPAFVLSQDQTLHQELPAEAGSFGKSVVHGGKNPETPH